MKALSVIGKRVPRIDSKNKVLGKTKYGVDLKFSGMLYGKVLRSTHPHARILNIDSTKAKRLKGVRAVITGEDTPKIKFGSMSWFNLPTADEHLLAFDKVRHIGDEIAAVAAIDEDTAIEALDLIEVDYEVLPAVFDAEESMKPDAPLIHEHLDNNIALYVPVERGDIKRAFNEADVIIEDKFTTPLQHQCHGAPTECIAACEGDKVTLWITSMQPFLIRSVLAKALNMKEGNIRIVNAPIGGAFGAKLEMQQLMACCAILSKKAGCPVKIVNEREEEFISTRPRQSDTFYVKTAAKNDGTLIGRQVKIIGNIGAYAGLGIMVPPAMINFLNNLYRIPNIKAESYSVYTNRVPTGAFRGFGLPQSNFAFEQHIDMVAEKIGMDPIELRLKNVVKPGDKTVDGWNITTCGIEDCLKKVRDSIGWNEKRKKKVPGRGLGVASVIFTSDWRYTDGFSGSVAFVRIIEDGKVQVRTSEPDWGQGSHTIYAQTVAEELSVPIEDVEMLPMDSDFFPYAAGPYGDRLTISGGLAVQRAAQDAREKILALAASELEANYEDLELAGGKIFVKGSPEKALQFSDFATYCITKKGGSAIEGKGQEEPDTVYQDESLRGNISSAYSFSAQAAEVEVDMRKGKVKILNFAAANDLGRALNPMSAEGQAEGSIAQAIGLCLGEEILYDKKGRVLNAGYLNYRIPTASDVPYIDTHLIETEGSYGPYGGKGAGEPSIGPGAAAIANAIYDAIGVRMKDLPITPQKIMNELTSQKKGGEEK